METYTMKGQIIFLNDKKYDNIFKNLIKKNPLAIVFNEPDDGVFIVDSNKLNSVGKKILKKFEIETIPDENIIIAKNI